eukprot:12129539-Alexandrium_andersonii.AAC.1
MSREPSFSPLPKLMTFPVGQRPPPPHDQSEPVGRNDLLIQYGRTAVEVELTLGGANERRGHRERTT